MTDKRYRILVVDDEPNNLQLMMQILNDRYQLAFAANGEKALEIARKLETDLILLDIMMPDMDGYEVCEKLKADERTKHIPVIFVTAKDEVNDETRGLGLGAIDYIAKPVSPSIVKARVKNHLDLKLARESLEKKNSRLEEQNRELLEAARLREDVERITRHDLKAPLNPIIALPRMMLEDESLSEKHAEYLKMVEESALRMLNMINLSLDLFKMERGIYELQPVPVNVMQVIGKIMNDLGEISERRGLAVNVLINGKSAGREDSFSVRGEELLCYSMLANLVKNAMEASPKKERIDIWLSGESDASVISISNRGTVPEDIRDRFFGKYVTSGKTSGVGLGTYSAMLIAQTHGGSIHLDTLDEAGTTVTVRLPTKAAGY